jgi:two-component system, OmpR family, response regulator
VSAAAHSPAAVAPRWVGDDPLPTAPAGAFSVGILGASHGPIVALLAEGLRARGHDVHETTTPAEGEVVLVVSPGAARISGLCRAAVSPKAGRAVVAVGEGGVDECIAALDAGADDYLRHPFTITELESRMRALVRRRRGRPPERLVLDDLVLEPAGMAASRGGVPIELTTGEFRMMEALLRAKGRVVSREELHVAMGNTRRSEYTSRAVDVCIHGPRDKVDRPFGATSIDTVRGVGYRLHAQRFARSGEGRAALPATRAA